ncbi:hypothetical protein B0H15DRAFT_833200 [Mycena belliarum]|uniref:Uncharacterized protein n=1 Tax=Mycena belliarum TaxID=1033014 RepID=A0AAD6UBW3_9AGAR|nr:hypothetical protein B0H15DRAFT_833200 [Mycena belliae]
MWSSLALFSSSCHALRSFLLPDLRICGFCALWEVWRCLARWGKSVVLLIVVIHIDPHFLPSWVVSLRRIVHSSFYIDSGTSCCEARPRGLFLPCNG